MADQLDRLKAALTGRYTLERELGRGGMATVWLARDIKHGRLVALKVLRPELAQAIGPERFLREITVTAGLDHPHILPLLDSGEADGFLFYTMPYVEGESLRERLTRDKQLPIDDALAITREVADALGYAHSRGVVHRDIKPENILLSGGHARVADFGIARAVAVAGEEKLTETGLVPGTPAYMSPEQGAGSPDLDGRSDIYSLGCVLYELLAGHPPFTGRTAQEVLARHSMDVVPLLTPARPTVPAHVERAARTAMAKVPADRFQVAAEFDAALAGARSQVVDRQGHRWRRLVLASSLTAAVVLAALGLWRRSRTSTVDSPARAPRVVVLPFDALGSPEERWFAAGMTEEITSRLSQIAGLAVMSRTSAALSAGKPLHQVGRELGVEFALEASIRTEPLAEGVRRVRVTAHLIRIVDDTHLWSESFSASLARGEVFDLQAQVAERVAQALHVTLMPGERGALRRQPTLNAEAYDAYLRARQYAHGQGYLPTDILAAIAMYRRAVELDSGFADAHALLSMQYSQLLGQVRAGGANRDSTLGLARFHADRAISLGPTLAWAHIALAQIHRGGGDWGRFRAELGRAAELDSTTGDVAQAVALEYSEAGAWNLALRFSQRALALDPLNADNAMALGFCYFALRRHAEAEPLIERAITLAPDRPEFAMYKAWLYLSWRGSRQEAIEVLQGAVQRMGFERAFAAGFLGSLHWGSRILGADPWYRSMLERVALGPPDVDSIDYYMHKAALFESLRRNEVARAYYDSVLPILQARLGAEAQSAAQVVLRAYLGIAYGALGNKERALAEARRCGELSPPGHGAHLSAWIYAAMGENGLAVEQFELALAVPNYLTPRLLALDPGLEPLRSLPRFRAILASGQ